MANKFKTIYSPPDKIVSCSGEKDRPDYKPKYIDGGSYELVEDGKIHSYDDIQAFLPECDISKIIDMYNKTGDEKLLMRRAGFYDEDSKIPSNYIELHNQIKNADLLFEGLPADIKANFGNSPAKFYSSEGNMAIIDAYYKAKENKKENNVQVSQSLPYDVKNTSNENEVKTDV